ncbi:MAG: SURF1 family protein [Marinicella sp.]
MLSKRFPWMFSLLWLLILLVMLWAGFWQLSRADEKRDIEVKMKGGKNHLPKTVKDWQALEPFDHVQITGQFSNTHFLLDNQIMDGQIGYFVFTVFKTNNDIWLLINRGWSNQELIDLEIDNFAEIELTGLLADWPVPGVQLGEQQVLEQAVQHVTYLSQNPVTELLKSRHCKQNNMDECIILARVLKLDPGMEYGYKRHWQLPRMTVAKHQAYAIQWFTMSLVLCLIYMIFLRKTYMKK